MTYGTIKVDTVTFTNDGVDKSVTLSGLVQNPTFSGNVTVTGTLSGVTVTGTTANFTSGNFTNISGGTHTITSGVFAAGSAASPSITFTGDLNTGIYSPGADQVAISTGGTGRLFVGSTGTSALGLNTAAGVPVAISSSTDGEQFRIRRIGGTYNPGLLVGLSDTASNEIIFNSTYSTGTAPSYVWQDAGNERMRLTGSGRLGVGTSSPSYTLQVAETSAVVSAASYSTFFGQGTRADLVLQATSSNNDQQRQVIRSNSDSLIFGTENAAVTTFTEKLRIDSSGRVGIGTSSPVAPLHVSGSGFSARLTDTQAYNFGTSGPVFDFTGNDSSGANTLFVRVQGSPANGGPDRGFLNVLTRLNGVNTSTLQVGTGFTADVLVPNGRLGVGSTTPGATGIDTGSTQLFVVAPNSNFGPAATFVADSVGRGLIISDQAKTNSFAINVGASSASIGTNAANTPVVFVTGAVEKARLDASGRLLVGTSSTSSASALVVQNNSSGNGVGVVRINYSTNSPGANDTLGIVSFGDNTHGEYASVAGLRDGGTWSASSKPTRLVFSTTADGASSPTERMRISNNGSHTITGGPGSSHTILTNNTGERIRWNDNGSYITTLPTTGSGANVHIWTGSSPANLLMLSTSSRRYKTDIENLESDRSDAILNFRPIWYRSTCELDRKDWSWYGLIAEEVAEIEPRLVHWTYLDDAYEINTKEDGTTEKVLKEDAELVPNGVQYDRLTVLLLDLAQRQEERITALEAKVAALEGA